MRTRRSRSRRADRAPVPGHFDGAMPATPARIALILPDDAATPFVTLSATYRERDTNRLPFRHEFVRIPYCRYAPVEQPRNTTRTGVHGPAQHAGDQVVPVGLRAAHVPTRLLLFSRSRYRRIDPHARRTGPGALENDRFARRLGRQPPRLSTLMARSQNCPRLPTEINRITDFADGVATMSAVRVARETDSPVLRTWRRWSWLPCPAGSCVLHQGRARCLVCAPQWT
jgi:hypothetical protein